MSRNALYLPSMYRTHAGGGPGRFFAVLIVARWSLQTTSPSRSLRTPSGLATDKVPSMDKAPRS
ncbi:hypothetical protein [Syntrophobacter fumaroxidans]|uniref:hypothetical protein n=1 Tax=Syntrophobacter fumaroxidans TaxID=119484 RepID=UPI00059E32C6|nr:hypothetical protein [Syntrophobacter fumaroxidans]